MKYRLTTDHSVECEVVEISNRFGGEDYYCVRAPNGRKDWIPGRLFIPAWEPVPETAPLDDGNRVGFYGPRPIEDELERFHLSAYKPIDMEAHNAALTRASAELRRLRVGLTTVTGNASYLRDYNDRLMGELKRREMEVESLSKRPAAKPRKVRLTWRERLPGVSSGLFPTDCSIEATIEEMP